MKVRNAMHLPGQGRQMQFGKLRHLQQQPYVLMKKQVLTGILLRTSILRAIILKF